MISRAGRTGAVLACAVAASFAAPVPADAGPRNGLIAYSQETDQCADDGCRSYIWTVRPDGRAKRRLPCSIDGRGCRDILPVFAPGGQRLANATNDADYDPEEDVFRDIIAVRRPGGMVLRRIPETSRALNALAWSADGMRLGFTTPGAIFTVGRDGSGEELYRDVSGGDLSWSLGGRHAWTPYAGGRVRVTNKARTRVRKLRVRADSVAWSPSGRRLAYVDGEDLMTMSPNGRHRRKLTGRCTGPQTGFNPSSDVAWSPGGRQLLCSTSSDKLLAVNVRTGRTRVVVRGVVGRAITSFDWQRAPRRR